MAGCRSEDFSVFVAEDKRGFYSPRDRFFGGMGAFM